MILDAQSITCRFGAFTAVDSVSFSLNRNEILGIAGTNGAGKSTLFAAIAGQFKSSSGSIVFDGQDIAEFPAYRRAQLGLVRTFQTPREFKSLTVLENLLVAAPNVLGEQMLLSLVNTPVQKRTEKALEEKADTVLAFLGLTPVRGQLAGGLSGGQKKLVELARVLMRDPSCILLDEPFAGVNPVLIEGICERIQILATRGISFVIVEHHLQALKTLVGRLIVMDQGVILTEGDPVAVLADPRVQAAYMGGVV